MKYKILDNFFDNEDFREIEKIQVSNVGVDKMKVYHNKILKDGKIESNECIQEETLKRFQKKYHQRAINILKELYPEKVDLYEFSEFHVIVTGSNYKFPLHDDTPTKLLSGVIYINPKENKGTMFFNDKSGNGKEIVDWKKNRGVFFSRKERETWHSFEGDGKSNRIALVYNLMTENIKAVCKIEKKNYLMSLIRYKFNPYIYRYFNFVI